TARIIVEDIKDLRTEKIKVVIERAKEIIRKIKESEPDIKEVIRRVESEAEKAPKLVEYGSEKLPAGPDVEVSDTIILVEGRADVLNLLRYGYTNVIALGGAKETIPESIKKLSQGKKVILFVDGDRGGELIALNVIGQIKVDYIARAPEGREVENLTGREIAKALSEMATVEEFIKKVKPAEAKPEVKPVTVPEAEAPPVEEQPPEAKPQPQPQQQIVETITVAIPKNIIGEIDKLKGTLEAVLYDQNWNDVSRVKVKDLFNTLQTLEPGKVFAVVFDGIVTQRLLEVASEKNISLLIGARMGTKLSFKPPNVRVLTFSDLT
ncbi:MAG: toprim domain-containing protein, partial [Acidilobaceae archaeon]